MRFILPDPGSQVSCGDGCACGRHGRPRMSPEEKRRRNRDRMRGHRLENPDGARAVFLRHRYGFTLAQYDEMLAAQGGACGLCGSTTPGGKGSFHVDHDHSCCPGKRSCGGCIRALLCTRCNGGLGLFGDDPELLAKAANYVKQLRIRLFSTGVS